MKRNALTVTLIIIALSSALMGCESSLETEAKHAMADELRDPDSAQFRNVVDGKSINGQETVCGEVNGKNGFGAYVGYRKFIYYSDGTLSLESGQPGQFVMDYMEECPSKFWSTIHS